MARMLPISSASGRGTPHDDRADADGLADPGDRRVLGYSARAQPWREVFAVAEQPEQRMVKRDARQHHDPESAETLLSAEPNQSLAVPNSDPGTAMTCARIASTGISAMADCGR